MNNICLYYFHLAFKGLQALKNINDRNCELRVIPFTSGNSQIFYTPDGTELLIVLQKHYLKLREIIQVHLRTTVEISKQ